LWAKHAVRSPPNSVLLIPKMFGRLAGGLRNVIVHEYFGIDLEIVWGVIERDLPALKKAVREILATS
jgi:uncharacterized protein with HEPN domain